MQTLQVILEGKLTVDSLRSKLEPVSAQLAAGSQAAMIVDVRGMQGYTTDARTFFVDWNRSHKRQLRCVAIVTDNVVWRMVIRAMSLASGQQMRPFSDHGAAATWVSEVSA